MKQYAKEFKGLFDIPIKFKSYTYEELRISKRYSYIYFSWKKPWYSSLIKKEKILKNCLF